MEPTAGVGSCLTKPDARCGPGPLKICRTAEVGASTGWLYDGEMRQPFSCRIGVGCIHCGYIAAIRSGGEQAAITRGPHQPQGTRES